MPKSDKIELKTGKEKSCASSLECVHINPKGVDSSSMGSTVSVSTANYGTLTDCSDIRRRKQDRAVSKEGICNFVPTNVERQGRKFMTDIFTTLLEVRWRWTLFIFCIVYFGSWTIFALIWYLILYIHGDIDNYGNANWQPCITGIQNFTSAFLFSVETQHTTGYGFYHLTELCPSAVILFCIQSIVGVILEGLMVGLVFVKMSRAKKRSETIMFSKNAVINMRDGILCFMFRVADMRKTHLLEAHVRAQFVKKRVTNEGEVIAYHQEEIDVGGDGEKDDKILLFWPTTVIHKITDSSPLRDITAADLHSYNNLFEIIVVLEGIVESTGLTLQARSSYLPSEILWGQRFENLTSCKTSSGLRAIDYALFHETYPAVMTFDENTQEKKKFKSVRKDNMEPKKKVEILSDDTNLKCVYINPIALEIEDSPKENKVNRPRKRRSTLAEIKSTIYQKNLGRAVSKEGTCNFVPTHVEKQGIKYMTDIFTTLLEVKWRWTLFAFCCVYFGSWLFFSLNWYAILYYHGDTVNFGNTNWEPCITGIQNFTSAFLFSVETQQTTGYGYYHLTEQCPPATIIFCIQSIAGCILEGWMVGLVFVKMSRAKKRSATIMFSKNAVISMRDGIKCFMFRVADMRTNHLLQVHVRAQLVRRRITMEGEVIDYHPEELEVGGDGEWKSNILMFWPTIVLHKITNSSPLRDITAADLNLYNNSFEIIVVLEGIVEATGSMVQARSSYLPSEILWGHRFENLTSCKARSGYTAIDYLLFHNTFSSPAVTPPDENDNSQEKMKHESETR
ncbi:Inward rectifier potassium channel irk-1 [Orchesella cincta]|uniref:Inward rectifier potassium channel irk-1 n=1 Tax=Orchesella cincta TaxID=48709 RepID=A0A1D2MUP8_ORCCI|nr:Inward rectifier potassium channel irk-1 [Orchesella cincta]